MYDNNNSPPAWRVSEYCDSCWLLRLLRDDFFDNNPAEDDDKNGTATTCCLGDVLAKALEIKRYGEERRRRQIELSKIGIKPGKIDNIILT